MAQNKYWEFGTNNTGTTYIIKATKGAIEKDDSLKKFEFEVLRYKDKDSGKEQIVIKAIVSKVCYGTIKANLSNIESRIADFKVYGIVLDRVKYVELCRLIKEKYYDIIPEIKNIDFVVTDEVAEEVFEMLCKYIYDNDIESKEVKDRARGIMELYHIPLTHFNSGIADSDFRKYNFTEIKEKLKEKEYTHTNKGKFDYVISENGLKIKCISVHKKKFEEILEKIS